MWSVNMLIIRTLTLYLSYSMYVYWISISSPKRTTLAKITKLKLNIGFLFFRSNIHYQFYQFKHVPVNYRLYPCSPLHYSAFYVWYCFWHFFFSNLKILHYFMEWLKLYSKWIKDQRCQLRVIRSYFYPSIFFSIRINFNLKCNFNCK